jgi:NADH dehydrogenase
VPLADLLPGVEIVLGRVESVSLTQQTVRVATDRGHRHLAYDELVVAVGSRDAVERVPGLAEHGWSLKNPNGLAAL